MTEYKTSYLTDEDKEDLQKYYMMRNLFSEEVPKDLSPVFYHTGSYTGDLLQRDKFIHLRDKLKAKELIL